MQYYQRQQAAKVGGIFDTVFSTINKALPLVLGTFQSLSAPNTGGQPAKGSAQIQAVVNQVISGLQQLLAGAPQLPQAETLSNAQQLVALLSNPQAVYQPKHGDDYNILTKGKQDANSLLQQIQAKYQQGSTSTVPVVTTDANGQLVTTNVPVAAPSALSQLTSNPVYLIGGVGILAILLTRK